MFAPHFFPTRYFAARYFVGGAPATPLPTGWTLPARDLAWTLPERT